MTFPLVVDAGRGVRPVVLVGGGDDLAWALRAEPVDLVGGPVEAVAQEHRDREQERDRAPAGLRPPNRPPEPDHCLPRPPFRSLSDILRIYP